MLNLDITCMIISTWDESCDGRCPWANGLFYYHRDPDSSADEALTPATGVLCAAGSPTGLTSVVSSKAQKLHWLNLWFCNPRMIDWSTSKDVT